MPPSDIEHYSPENEIFTGSDGGDDFAYSKSGRADFRGDDGEIPQYFSTSDEDLDPDSYRNRPEREAEIGGEPAAGPAQETPDEILPLSDPSYESFAEAEAARQDRRNNRRNWKQNNRDNPRGAGQNPRQQNQNQKFQQNRSGGQNRQQPNQNRQQPNQQRFQQGGGQNPRQQNQNRQPQQQKKKPAWKQADADSEAMNPGDLPDWEVLKSEAGISRWLEGIFEGKSASDSGMGTGARTETGESPEAAAPEQEAAEDTPAQAPVPPEEMSYWQLLSSSNDSRIERPAKPEAGEAEPGAGAWESAARNRVGSQFGGSFGKSENRPGIFGRDFFPFARRFRHRLRHRLRRIVPSSHKGFAREVRRAFNSPQRRGVKGGNSRRIFPRRARRRKNSCASAGSSTYSTTGLGAR